MKVLHPDLMDPFLRNAPRFQPLIGLSRKPGAALPPLPDQEYAEKLQQGKIKYDHKAVQPDYCYWFLKPQTEEQTALYFGMGGLMMLFAVPPEGAKMPVPVVSRAVMEHPQFKSLLAENRLQQMTETMQKATSPFFPKTKTVFGRGLEDDLQFPGLKFIVPLLSAADFADATPAAIEEWFSVFDVLLTESPTDRGLLLASRHDVDLDPILTDLVRQMRDNDAVYAEFA